MMWLLWEEDVEEVSASLVAQQNKMGLEINLKRTKFIIGL
jgi:hypothetical protein